MTHVITDTCMKDLSCVAVCPVDCILPGLSEVSFEGVEQLYIDPDSCIDCGSCVAACPIGAIHADFDVPDKYRHSIELNEAFFSGSEASG